MKYLLRDVMSTLEHSELLKIRKELKNGSVYLTKVVNEQIKENEKSHERYCAVCSSDIDPNSTTTYTLMFGPDGFKKKATFCAVDCMRYFLEKLDSVNNDIEKKDEEKTMPNI